MTNYDILKEYEAHQTPVPSYEEWKALNGNMDSVMQTNQALCKKLAELKELLERCRDELFEIYSNEVSHPEDVPIIKKLDEVLQ